MTKAQIVEKIKQETGFQKTTIEVVVDCFLGSIAEEITNGVSLSNFGTFTVKNMAPRIGRNPHTGEVVYIDGKTVPVFKPSPKLREKVLRDAEYNH